MHKSFKSVIIVQGAPFKSIWEQFFTAGEGLEIPPSRLSWSDII